MTCAHGYGLQYVHCIAKGIAYHHPSIHASLFDFGIKSVRPRAGNDIWVIRLDDERTVFYNAKKGERWAHYDAPCCEHEGHRRDEVHGVTICLDCE